MNYNMAINVLTFMVHVIFSLGFVLYHVIMNAENLRPFWWCYGLYGLTLMVILYRLLCSAEERRGIKNKKIEEDLHE